MQFFKGYRDVKSLICAQLELPDLLALKAVDRDCRQYIDQYHLDKHYGYILGELVQIGEMGRSLITYKFPTEEQIRLCFPKRGNVLLYHRRGDIKEALKTLHEIDGQDHVMTRPIFMVKINLPREPKASRIFTYSVRDELNDIKEQCTMVVNEIDVSYLIPCRAMIIDDQNRIVKHRFSDNKGMVQQRNFMELSLVPEVNADSDAEYTKSKCIIL